MAGQRVKKKSQRKVSAVTDDPVLSDEDNVLLDEYQEFSGFLANLDERALSNAEVVDGGSVSDVKGRISRKRKSNFDEDAAESDDEAERDFELAPRLTKSWDTDKKDHARLPIKDKFGAVRLPTDKLEPAVAALEIQRTKTESHTKQPTKAPEDEPEGQGLKVLTDSFGKPLTGAVYIEARKIEMAAIASAVTENPESKMNQLKVILDMMLDSNVVVKQLAMLTLLAVFKDVLPGYRIRELTEAEQAQKVSKDVKKLRKFEEAMLKTYHTFLQRLDAVLKEARQASKQERHKADRPQTDADQHDKVAVTAMQCMCGMLIAKPHFNFRANLLNVIVARMTTTYPPQIGTMCCESIVELFRIDERGDVALEAVRLIVRMIKAKSYNVPVAVLETFLHLRLLEELTPSEAGVDLKDGKPSKAKPNNPKANGTTAHISRKKRKLQKEDKELQKELDESAAEYSKDERQRLHRETLKAIFQIYFRLLKNMHASPMLTAVLQGLARYAHLISIDFFNDLLAVLKLVATTKMADVECALQCVLTTFQLASGYGDALQLDLKDFFSTLYELLLMLPNNGGVLVPKALTAVELMFCKKRQLSLDRVASFIKRLSTVAIHLPSHAALATIATVHALLQRYGKTQALLDSEQAGLGAYLPDIHNPDIAQPFASTLWELGSLQMSYHPTVVRLSRRVATGHSGGVIGSAVSIFNEYDISTGGFFPPVQPKSAQNKSSQRLTDTQSQFLQSLEQFATSFRGNL